MSGKHASRVSALRSTAALALLGARELVAFTAIGVIAPVALLLTVPSLLDEGRAMPDAPVCESGGQDCLEPRAAELTAADSSTWTLSTGATTKVDLTFPTSERPDSSGELHVLFWNDEPVALLQDDGAVVGSLHWARLYGVSKRTLLLTPLWPVAVLAVAAPLLWRRRRAHVLLLGVFAAGAAAAGPTAYAGMLRTGYPGLVAGGLVPVAAALVIAGPLLWVVRRQARRPRKAAVTNARMPQQRAEAQEPEPAPEPAEVR
ncbi:MAG TPA: hypothetical protein VFK41_04375 [Nocardioidaceae bacterium]|nr:hypothetical protein [Nocardioidaceae bacterium]